MSYSALLRLAEHFRQANEIGCALQCLQAAQDKTQNQFQSANVNLLLGSLLLKHAKNVSECKHYLLNAINQIKQCDIRQGWAFFVILKTRFRGNFKNIKNFNGTYGAER